VRRCHGRSSSASERGAHAVPKRLEQQVDVLLEQSGRGPLLDASGERETTQTSWRHEGTIVIAGSSCSKQHGVLLGISVDGDDAVQLNGSFRTTVGGNLVARPEVGGQRVGAENANLSFQGPSGVETFDIRIPNANELQGVFSVGIRDDPPWFLARKLSPKQYSLYRPRGPEIDLMSWRDATLTGVGNVILGAPSSPGSNLCEVVSQCW
jgi:hypothetical protein